MLTLKFSRTEVFEEKRSGRPLNWTEVLIVKNKQIFRKRMFRMKQNQIAG